MNFQSIGNGLISTNTTEGYTVRRDLTQVKASFPPIYSPSYRKDLLEIEGQLTKEQEDKLRQTIIEYQSLIKEFNENSDYYKSFSIRCMKFIIKDLENRLAGKNVCIKELKKRLNESNLEKTALKTKLTRLEAAPASNSATVTTNNPENSSQNSADVLKEEINTLKWTITHLNENLKILELEKNLEEEKLESKRKELKQVKEELIESRKKIEDLEKEKKSLENELEKLAKIVNEKNIIIHTLNASLTEVQRESEKNKSKVLKKKKELDSAIEKIKEQEQFITEIQKKVIENDNVVANQTLVNQKNKRSVESSLDIETDEKDRKRQKNKSPMELPSDVEAYKNEWPEKIKLYNQKYKRKIILDNIPRSYVTKSGRKVTTSPTQGIFWAADMLSCGAK